MTVKKVTDRVELNVSAQGCKNDCSYYKTYSAQAVRQDPKNYTGHGCKKVTDARWCKWW